jgi:hypothetical protein
MQGVSPPLGPYSTKDTMGMGLVVCILIRTLDPGRTEELIQFSMVRYLRSVYQQGMAVMAHNTSKIWVTKCPSYGYWFERLGEEVRSDFALSIRVLHKVLGHVDREWTEARTAETRRQVVEIAIFFVVAYCLALRGEEVVKMDIAGFLMYYEAGRNHDTHPHVMVPLLGRFKGETGESWHVLPIV